MNWFRRKIKKTSSKATRPLAKRYYEVAHDNAARWGHAAGGNVNDLIETDLATLRHRCRYELRNNSYALGMVLTLANDIIGNGPKLQVLGPDEQANTAAEAAFSRWAADCDLTGHQDLAEILRLAIIQLCEAGEVLIKIQAQPGGLRLLCLEPGRLQSPSAINPRIYMGVELDASGRVIHYHLTNNTDGITDISTTMMAVPAAEILHLYRIDRPGQLRGVPWLTPALGLFGQLRDYTRAVLKAANRAATISAFSEQLTPEAIPDEIIEGQDYSELELPEDAFLQLPYGRKISQLKAEQPTANYEMFKREIINEIARCLNMPLNIALCNSSGYNYSSGQLDHLTYFRAIDVVRQWLEAHLLNPLLRKLILAPGGGNLEKYQWHWKNRGYADPTKIAAAQKIELNNGTTTLADIYACKGQDWQRQLVQQATEKEMKKDVGLIEEKTDADRRMESFARAVRAGVPISVNEVRAALGLKVKPDSGGELLRFNDQDLLQYHIENGIVTINEARKRMNLPAVSWGDVPVRKSGVTPVGAGEESNPVESDGKEDE